MVKVFHQSALAEERLELIFCGVACNKDGDIKFATDTKICIQAIKVTTTATLPYAVRQYYIS